MRLLLSICLILSLCSCATVKPVGCAVEQSVAAAISAAVSTSLSCTNLSQIQSDVMSSLGKANVCSMQSSAKMVKRHLKGPIGDIVCPLAVQSAMGLLTIKVPQSWGCSPSASLSGLSQVLTKACSAVVPI